MRTSGCERASPLLSPSSVCNISLTYICCVPCLVHYSLLDHVKLLQVTSDPCKVRVKGQMQGSEEEEPRYSKETSYVGVCVSLDILFFRAWLYS